MAEAERVALHLHPDHGARTGQGFVLVLPGGGYAIRAPHEAGEIVDFLAERGIRAGHLEYPVAPARYPEALTQVLAAISDLRAGRHGEFSGPISVIGFSAGGHLAGSTATATHQECALTATQFGLSVEAVARPDSTALGYPVVSLTEHSHGGSRVNLLGEVADQVAAGFGIQHRVDGDTGSLFVFHTVADDAVPVQNALLLVDAAQRSDVPIEAHLYAEGEHGVGLALGRSEAMSAWSTAWLAWLERHGITGDSEPSA